MALNTRYMWIIEPQAVQCGRVRSKTDLSGRPWRNSCMGLLKVFHGLPREFGHEEDTASNLECWDVVRTRGTVWKGHLWAMMTT